MVILDEPPGVDTTTVLLWRYEQLIKAGYPARLATLLADDPTVDLHQAEDIAGHGCPPLLAVRILKGDP